MDHAVGLYAGPSQPSLTSELRKASLFPKFQPRPLPFRGRPRGGSLLQEEGDRPAGRETRRCARGGTILLTCPSTVRSRPASARLTFPGSRGRPAAAPAEQVAGWPLLLLLPLTRSEAVGLAGARQARPHPRRSRRLIHLGASAKLHPGQQRSRPAATAERKPEGAPARFAHSWRASASPASPGPRKRRGARWPRNSTGSGKGFGAEPGGRSARRPLRPSAPPDRAQRQVDGSPTGGRVECGEPHSSPAVLPAPRSRLRPSPALGRPGACRGWHFRRGSCACGLGAGRPRRVCRGRGGAAQGRVGTLGGGPAAAPPFAFLSHLDRRGRRAARRDKGGRPLASRLGQRRAVGAPSSRNFLTRRKRPGAGLLITLLQGGSLHWQARRICESNHGIIKLEGILEVF